MSEFWRKCRLFLAKFFDYEWGGKSDNDIRWTVELLDYAFEGGKFSPNPNAYPNCQGVVVWINPDSSAPVGDRVYVLLFGHERLCYSDEYYGHGADTDADDGRANTKKLIEYGKEHNIRFPAAEYAYNYCKNGVKRGDAFLPAINQLKHINNSGFMYEVADRVEYFDEYLCTSDNLLSSTASDWSDVCSANLRKGLVDNEGGRSNIYLVCAFITY